MRCCRLTVALSALALLWSPAAHAAKPEPVQVRPSRVSIGLLYGGHEVRVRAETPAGCDVAVLVTGKRRDLRLKKIRKRGGLLWMGAGSLRYRDVPGTYFVRSSRRLSDLAPPQTLRKLGLGYPALRHRITRAKDHDAQEYFPEMIKLLEHDGLFSVAEHDVKLRPAVAGKQIATTSFRMPPKAGPGRYSVRVLCFRDQALAWEGQAHVDLQFDHSVAWLSGLARKHGLVYGILACLIAIAAGLLTGLIFGRKGGAH